LVNRAIQQRSLDGQHHFNDAERELFAKLYAAQREVHAALCDSFDTPTAIQALASMVQNANSYIKSVTSDKGLLNTSPLEAVAEWITKLLRIFGLGEGPAQLINGKEIGWGEPQVADGVVPGNREAVLLPYLQALSKFRDDVRSCGRDNREILALCDRLRDEDLVDLGVALDDQPDGHALVKLVPRETLIKAREEKQAQAALKAEKAAEKKRVAEETARAKAEAQAKELELGRSTPKEWFGSQTDKYSAFNEEGLPTHDEKSEPLAKSAQKRLKKEWDLQAKRHEKYLKSIEGT